MNMLRDINRMLHIRLFLSGLIFGMLASSDAIGEASELEFIQADCITAISLSCGDGTANVDYSLSPNLNTQPSSCLSVIDSAFVGEAWFSFNATGNNGYYLDVIDANIGINIFSGTCQSLVLYDCVETYNAVGSYWVDNLLPEGDYLIQVLSLIEDENIGTTLNFGCFDDPGNDCMVEIDFVNVSDCIDGAGYVDVAVGGNTNRNTVSLEVTVDGDLHFFTCAVNDGFWIGNFEIQGQTLEYVSAYAGNSSSGCSASMVEAMQIPTTNCNGNDVDLLKFHDSNTPFCSPTYAEVKMFQSGTATLKHDFTAQYDEVKNSYVINNPPFGVYDIYIKPLGGLQQGFGDVNIVGGTQTLLLDAIIKGDLNNSNSINIVDISILTASFNSIEGDESYNSQADLNCSGSINISDISLFGSNFNEEGDEPPFSE